MKPNLNKEDHFKLEIKLAPAFDFNNKDYFGLWLEGELLKTSASKAYLKKWWNKVKCSTIVENKND